jgi:hypothetical protein
LRLNGGQTWAFVTKFAADAKTLIFATYMGGSANSDAAYGIALDSSGNAFVVGYTVNDDFPVTSGAYQTVCSPNFGSGSELPGCSGTSGGGAGSPSAFVTKLSPTGALLDSTFLSGTGTQSVAYTVAVDSAGRRYVEGWTLAGANVPAGAPSTQQVGFPTTSGAALAVPPYETQGGNRIFLDAFNQDAFIAVFNPSLSILMYSSLIGDSQVSNGNIGFQSSASTLGHGRDGRFGRQLLYGRRYRRPVAADDAGFAAASQQQLRSAGHRHSDAKRHLWLRGQVLARHIDADADLRNLPKSDELTTTAP